MAAVAAPAGSTSETLPSTFVPLELPDLGAEDAFELRAELNRLFAIRELPYVAQFRSPLGGDFALEIEDRSEAAARWRESEVPFSSPATPSKSLRSTAHRVVRWLEQSRPRAGLLNENAGLPVSPGWCVWA